MLYYQYKYKGGKIMSVNKLNRGKSQSQYCYNCFKIYELTTDFLSRLTYHYNFLSSGITVTLAELFTQARTVDIISQYKLTDKDAKATKRQALLKLIGLLKSLDGQFTIITKKIYEHPENSFTTLTGNKVSKTDAIHKLDYYCDELGCLLTDTITLIEELIFP